MSDHQWFWCLDHGRAEQGVGCRAERRLGPYPSADDAANWRQLRDAREQAWEDDDRRWSGDDGR